MNQIIDTFDNLPAPDSDVPTMIVSNTVKGKYISFMEKQLKWHAGSFSKENLDQALADLKEAFEKQKKEAQ